MRPAEPPRPDGDAEEAQAMLFGVISVGGTLLMLTLVVHLIRALRRWWLG